MLKPILLRLRALFRQRATEGDLDDEIRLHLSLETEKNIAAGMPPAAARRKALLDFGGVEHTKEAHRDGWGVRWLLEAAADARYALRALRKNPVLAGAAVVTLALGIGANTAIFSAVNAVILRPLPFSHPDRLFMLWESNPEYGWEQDIAAPANMLDWREQVPAFADVAAYAAFNSSATLTGVGRSTLIRTSIVTGNFFSVLGIAAERGRLLRDAETWQTSAHVAVISDRLWRTQFAGDPEVVGRTIVLDGGAVQIVGVAPRTFHYPYDAVDAWLPFAWDPADRAKVSFRRAHYLFPIARLRPGVSLETANAQLQSVVTRLQREYPATNRVMGAGMTPLHEFLVSDTRQPLLILLAAVALLLLIACANVGNLLLVQAAGREREAAMRLTLGAGRGRLVRQALTESLVLSAIGGAAGLAVGWWGTQALLALRPLGLLPVHDVGMDWRVLIYVLAITTASGLLFGIAPAIWSGSRAPAEVLKDGGRIGGASIRTRRWSQALVVGEVAIALLLLVGAGLLVRSFQALTAVAPGFDAHRVLTVELNTAGPSYDTADKVRAFRRRLVRRIRTLPGVESAAATAEVPLTWWGWSSQFVVAGWPAGKYSPDVAHREVTPGYFGVMHVPILRGRDFTARDTKDAPPVVLINEALAHQFFPSEDPIGQRVAFDKVPDAHSVWYTIVGVVGDERQASLGTVTKPQFTTAFAQSPSRANILVVRTANDPASLAPAVRSVVADLDPSLAISSIKTMDEIRSASLDRQRFLMTMLLVFAGVGLLLAIVGLYGVMAQFARGRTREMGIRLALGARTAQVQWLVVRRGLGLVCVGLAAGLAAALATTQVMKALLFGVTPADPVTFVAVPIVLVVTAAAAIWIPAVRASRADPATTLREE